MLNAEQKIKEQFSTGFNCSQLIVKNFAEKLNYDENLASGIALGFGGGMGRLQETCGAVTGAFMVLGIYNDKMQIMQNDKKTAAYEMVRQFNNKFLELHKSTKCSELLGVDMKTLEGQQVMKEKNLSVNVCEKCVKDSIRILNEMI